MAYYLVSKFNFIKVVDDVSVKMGCRTYLFIPSYQKLRQRQMAIMILAIQDVSIQLVLWINQLS
ncbi:hypothetical protein B5J93_00870 [Moraxella equi]|uniref:Uncharacterized protein n=1 Tax=Moraxella equi TaxID=60442 RepID=A0ABX3NL69_9GAMM|nr:hypothetical protein B5J93_00870 [Moraxella equi]